ncbi:MAG: hypothetical protein CL610_09965 [Anaerolineaceae bacterium]|nr:hypothetical protein [Anaerolineaceae bacterium]
MSEKILIVDDDIDSLKLIGLMLQRHGYEVMAANAGMQALSKAGTDRPDLIILDVMMPDMDGYEVCRRLRANQATRGIPIIMFTAKTLVDDKVAGFEAGADDYLTKPTHPAELASRVKAILARSAGQRSQVPSRGMTMGFIGAKGGVGTTTLALNATAALVLGGETPIVADFRLGSGSLSLLLGMPHTASLANVLTKPVADITPATLEKELYTHASNIRALLSSINPQEAQLQFAQEAAAAVISNLRLLSHHVIVDLGSQYNATVQHLQHEMDQIVLVVDPFRITLAMARELIQELEDTTSLTDRIHVVAVNRTPHNLPWSEIEQTLGRELRAVITDAPDLAQEAARTTTPMTMLQPNAIVSNQIVKLTEDLNTRTRAMAGSRLLT